MNNLNKRQKKLKTYVLGNLNIKFLKELLVNILLIFLVSWPNRNFNDNELILIDSFKDMNLLNEKGNNYNENINEIKEKNRKMLIIIF